MIFLLSFVMLIDICKIANNYEINNLGLYKRPTKAKYVINYLWRSGRFMVLLLHDQNG